MKTKGKIRFIIILLAIAFLLTHFTGYNEDSNVRTSYHERYQTEEVQNNSGNVVLEKIVDFFLNCIVMVIVIYVIVVVVDFMCDLLTH